MQKELAVTLNTRRLCLRPLSINDVDLLWPDISDPEISRYMAWEAHLEKSQTLDFLRAEVARREAGKGVTWGIFKDGEFCGIASLIALIWAYRSLTYNKAELAYWLGRRYWRQGIMTEAIYQIMQFGFQELGLHKICVSHFSPNSSSEKIIKRLGFRYVGEQLDEYRKDGIWYNQKNYEILDKEFYKLKTSFSKENNHD